MKRNITWTFWLIVRLTTLFFASASEDGEEEDGSESGSGDEAWNSYGDGDDDFFAFVEYEESAFHWSDYAIYPDACLARNNQDLVVFSLYAANHNNCKKKSLGKFSLTVPQYILAFTKTAEKEAELGDYDYDEPAALDYLQCTATAADDDGTQIYTKIGCNSNNWRQFSVKSYTDTACSVEASTNYVYNVDLSDVTPEYTSCTSCTNWDAPDDGAEVDDQFETNSEYFSPLCTAAWYYRETCDSSCIKATKIATGEINPRSFTMFQVFFLIFYILSGVYFFLQVVRERRKMSEEDAMYEEASVASVGIKKDNLPKMFLGYSFFMFLLILFKAKKLVFTILIITNVCLILYFSLLQYRSAGRVELGGYHIYGEKEEYDERDSTEMT